MTKLSAGLRYRLLRRWDHLCRVLPLQPRYEIWSDASGKGYGGHLGPQSHPLDVWQATHDGLVGGRGSTECVEAQAVLLSLERWADQLSGKRVYCYVDNYTVYTHLFRRYRPARPSTTLAIGDVMRNMTIPGKCPAAKETFEKIDKVIRKNGIELRARWVWGKDNHLADRLSRMGKGRQSLSPHVRALLEASQALAAPDTASTVM